MPLDGVYVETSRILTGPARRAASVSVLTLQVSAMVRAFVTVRETLA